MGADEAPPVNTPTSLPPKRTRRQDAGHVGRKTTDKAIAAIAPQSRTTARRDQRAEEAKVKRQPPLLLRWPHKWLLWQPQVPRLP